MLFRSIKAAKEIENMDMDRLEKAVNIVKQLGETERSSSTEIPETGSIA